MEWMLNNLWQFQIYFKNSIDKYSHWFYQIHKEIDCQHSMNASIFHFSWAISLVKEPCLYSPIYWPIQYSYQWNKHIVNLETGSNRCYRCALNAPSDRTRPFTFSLKFHNRSLLIPLKNRLFASCVTKFLEKIYDFGSCL